MFGPPCLPMPRRSTAHTASARQHPRSGRAWGGDTRGTSRPRTAGRRGCLRTRPPSPSAWRRRFVATNR
eukprot:6920670-Prymnesium_polylepis.1